MKTVLLPTLLLVWAIIAFFYEGNDWNNRRTQIEQFNAEQVGEDEKEKKQEGMLIRELKESDIKKG